MKLLILKLCSLVVLVAGVALVLWTVQAPPFLQLLDTHGAKLPGGAEGFPNEKLAYVAGGVVAALLGLYAFLPKRGRDRKRAREIRFDGDHGEVVIQLDSVQRALTNVIMRMPEVKRVLVKVDSDNEGKRALITADVVIYSQPEVRARQTANDVTEYIAQSAIQVLGLEDLATIKLNVVGIEVNPKQASKHIRSEYQQRVEALKRPKLEYQPAAKTESRETILASAAAVAPAPAPEPVPMHREDFAESVAEEAERDAETSGINWEESREPDGDLVIEAEKEELIATAETEGVYNDGGFASTERDETALGPDEELPVAEEASSPEAAEKRNSWF